MFVLKVPLEIFCFFIFNCVSMCVSICGFVLMGAVPHKGEKRASDPPELESHNDIAL